jgi:hypothetical protein
MGEAKPLAHAQRIAADPPVSVPGQADGAEELLGPRARHADDGAGDAQRLPAGAAAVEGGGVEQRADGPRGVGQIGQRLAGDGRAARVGPGQAGDDAQRGGLSE